MSFLEYSREIKENDLVLAWMTRTSVKPINTEKGQVLNTRYGSFPHDAMLDQKFGTQIPSSSAQGFIHLLAPSPELWTLSLPHRTQIVYTPDASYIVQRLKIRPGSRVIEAGTGSGSFTHAITRSVGQKGKIFTYEFHEPRFLEAKKEIDDHGLSSVVTITHRDVCNDGFELRNGQENLDIDASAVFLDLPSPWTAITKLKPVVARNRAVHICCFSPCMEQVTRTVEALRKVGFQRIEMVEVSARKWEGRKEMVRSVDDAVERLRDVRKRRDEGLKKRNERKEKDKRLKRSLSEDENVDSSTSVNQEDALQGDDDKQGSEEADSSSTPRQAGKKGYNPWGKGLRIKEGDSNYEWRNISRVESEIKTHTSYLTFAVLPPPPPI
jgi:tRNA (adenine57-N1/adenine58-N1)-methyltransferase